MEDPKRAVEERNAAAAKGGITILFIMGIGFLLGICCAIPIFLWLGGR
jgi:hypothetical protein